MTRNLGGAPDRQIRWALFALLIVWAWVAGKDVSWDVVNHQLYLPFAAWTARYRTDLFGAGPQSYQNPLGYLPVYALVRSGWPAWSIGVGLAALHGLAVWPLNRIARRFWPGPGDADWRALALAACCIAPIFLIHVGTPSLDPVTTLLVLWAVAWTLESTTDVTGPARAAFAAGACLGLASALKLSNALFAVTVAALWLLQWALGQRHRREVALGAAGIAASFALAAGPWMWVLWRDFGNPIFPLYNDVFHSPFAPVQAIVATRFVIHTAGGAVARLWELAQLKNFVSFEAFVPDVRPLLAALAAVVAVSLRCARGGWRRVFVRDTWRSPGVQLALLLGSGYLLWLVSSGNARYGMPLFVLTGVALVRATQGCLPPRPARQLLLVAVLLQFGYYASAGDRRILGADWDSGPWIGYRLSRRLQEQPFLHLTLGTQTDASVALALAPDGALANPIGQFALPDDGPLGQRFESLLSRWRGRTRVLMPTPPLATPDEARRTHEGFTRLLYRLRLDIDWHDCETIEVRPSRNAREDNLANSHDDPRLIRSLSSCAVLDRPQRDPVVDAQRAEADRIFSILESACPKVFAPRPFASERGDGVWQRHYMNTEALLAVSAKQGVYYGQSRAIAPTNFGSIQDILQHRRPIACPQPFQ